MKERALVNLGAVTAVACMAAVFEAATASSLGYGLACGAISVASLGLFLFALKGSRVRRPGAPTNTQLQQPPPAIVRRANDGT